MGKKCSKGFFISLFVLSSLPISFSNANVEDNKAGIATCTCEAIPQRFVPTHPGMVAIPAGTLIMGGDDVQAKADEFPKHRIKISSFWMDQTPVTNAQFAAFVKATHYVTTAEQSPDWEILKKQLPIGTPKPDKQYLVPASLVFTQPNHPVSLTDASQWWKWTPGANWQHPHGPQSTVAGPDHPVVQVSWEDAAAFCQWKGGRLPTEAEWEWAARGGLVNQPYPWGQEDVAVGPMKANTWQGNFPYENTVKDRYFYTSPVKSFKANGYGLYDISGNVWEWVADWYDHDYYARTKNEIQDPQGPLVSYDPREPRMPKKVLRGGSFLCNARYCSGYRVSARMKASPDTGMEHIGFRCARSKDSI